MVADDEPHLTRTEARGGSSNHVSRYVLAISLALIIVIFGVLIFAWR